MEDSCYPVLSGIKSQSSDRSTFIRSKPELTTTYHNSGEYETKHEVMLDEPILICRYFRPLDRHVWKRSVHTLKENCEKIQISVSHSCRTADLFYF